MWGIRIQQTKFMIFLKKKQFKTARFLVLIFAPNNKIKNRELIESIQNKPEDN